MSNDEYFFPDDGSQEQFHQEYQMWREEQELQDEALNDYLIALCEYYGDLKERA